MLAYLVVKETGPVRAFEDPRLRSRVSRRLDEASMPVVTADVSALLVSEKEAFPVKNGNAEDALFLRHVRDG